MDDQFNKLSHVTGAVEEGRKDWRVICKNTSCGNKLNYVEDATRWTRGDPAAWRCTKCDWETKEQDNPQIDMPEMTTSGDIAYAPQMGFRNPTKKELKAIGMAHESVNEEKTIEGEKDAIVKLVSHMFDKTRLSVDEFTRAFPRNGDATPESVFMRITHFPEDLEKLRKKLPNDMGQLNLIKNAIVNRRPLSVYDPFRGYANLYGCRLSAQVAGTKMVYEAAMRFTYQETETLLIDDIDVIAQVADEVDTVRVADRLVFPLGGIFEPSFFTKVKSLVISPASKPEIGGKK